MEITSNNTWMQIGYRNASGQFEQTEYVQLKSIYDYLDKKIDTYMTTLSAQIQTAIYDNLKTEFLPLTGGTMTGLLAVPNLSVATNFSATTLNCTNINSNIATITTLSVGSLSATTISAGTYLNLTTDI